MVTVSKDYSYPSDRTMERFILRTKRKHVTSTHTHELDKGEKRRKSSLACQVTLDGLCQGGLSQGSLPQDGLSQSSLPQDGLSQDGLSQDGLSQGGLSQGGLPQGGLSQDSPSQDGLLQGRSTPSDSATSKPLKNNPHSTWMQVALLAPYAGLTGAVSWTAIRRENLSCDYCRLLSRAEEHELLRACEERFTYNTGRAAQVQVFGQWRDIPRKQVMSVLFKAQHLLYHIRDS